MVIFVFNKTKIKKSNSAIIIRLKEFPIVLHYCRYNRIDIVSCTKNISKFSISFSFQQRMKTKSLFAINTDKNETIINQNETTKDNK